jgi:predicted kinase
VKLVIMSGIPGSGKSTFVRLMADARVAVCSADHHLPKEPKPEDFGRAHGACYLDTIEAVYDAVRTGAYDTVVVDNTNTEAWEIAPYVLLAQAYDIPHEVVRVHADVAVAWARKVHEVPMSAFCHMFANFARRDVKPWWHVREVASSPMERFLPL